MLGRHCTRNRLLWQRRFARRKFGSSSTTPPDPAAGSNRWLQAGAFLMGLVVLEQSWQHYQNEKRKSEFQSTLAQMQQEANAYTQRHPPDAARLPTLFSCRVVQNHTSLDGALMLRDVRVGDIVQVVTAEVGPDQAYHLCRCRPKDGGGDEAREVGWYPKRFLKRLKLES